MGPHLLATSWLDQLNAISTQATTTGKAAGAAVAIVFILAAYAVKRTLGAVFAALVVAGLVLYGINNTDTLQKNTKDTLSGMIVPASAGGGAGGGGGGSY
jgi:hypothetical protein